MEEFHATGQNAKDNMDAVLEFYCELYEFAHYRIYYGENEDVYYVLNHKVQMKKEKWWRKLTKTVFSQVAELDNKHFTYVIQQSKVQSLDVVNYTVQIGMSDYTLILGVRGIWMKPTCTDGEYEYAVSHDVVSPFGFRDADLNLWKKEKN